MTPEERAVEEASAQKEFSIVRKGYDPAEVDAQLAEYDEALSELEEYVARLSRELQDARHEIARMKAAEKDAVEQAMAAVFDAKERIIDRAMAKAKEIENQALTTAGHPTVELPVAATDDLVEAAAAAADTPTGVGPDDVLQQMLTEAETIRTRLDVGLAAAFDQMEQMQQDAEQRASSLLDDAKREADRLRATAAVSAAETIIEVQLPQDAPEPKDRTRQSRYSRNSAGLPRIGEDGEASVIETMNGLRTKFRESEEAAQ